MEQGRSILRADRVRPVGRRPDIIWLAPSHDRRALLRTGNTTMICNSPGTGAVPVEVVAVDVATQFLRDTAPSGLEVGGGGRIYVSNTAYRGVSAIQTLTSG